jgi:hypothetical protein
VPFLLQQRMAVLRSPTMINAHFSRHPDLAAI